MINKIIIHVLYANTHVQNVILLIFVLFVQTHQIETLLQTVTAK